MGSALLLCLAVEVLGAPPDPDYSKAPFGMAGREISLYCGALSQNRKRIAVGGNGGGSDWFVWDIETGEKKSKGLMVRGWPLGLALSPDGKTLAIGSGTYQVPGSIELWDVGSGNRKGTLKKHKDTVMCLGFSDDGKLLASGGIDGAKLWDVAEEKLLQEVLTDEQKGDAFL
jgi:WD40 repeat protein